MLRYTPTPTVEITDPIVEKAGVRLLIKREDLNHPLVSGNKWWKLKYNLAEAQTQNKKTLLTFGGAYSNHIYATAAGAAELGFKSIGIIRGEETLPLNSTLSFAKQQGMSLHYVSRELYRTKTSSQFIDALEQRFGDFYLIPEGGTNALAVKGAAEFAQTLNTDFDYLCCPIGTGGTLAGLINGLPKKKVIGFSVLKGGEFLVDDIRALTTVNGNWNVVSDYHFGGYAKTNSALEQFIRTYEANHAIPLDQVYTGKMMAGIYDLIQKGHFVKGNTILAIHTGGLQGKSVF
ncbi:MAG: 1-aminocyclopropane-1-carboxylate deaminase/D-cysteine desulfhydrase [Cyclobacteriaceae bacterium]|nr:MAG: 1-aminocyclopropane-1-carboxylate deaminase/D-cysteine desulfhydrase [Cyclobacteriaceae bacterium]